MRKLLFTIFTSTVVALSGVGLSFAQDGSNVPNLTPIELQICNFHDGQDRADYDKAVGVMKKWMDDNDAEPYAAWRLNSFYTGAREDFDFIYIGAWTSGTSMGKDIAQYRATAGSAIAASEKAADCGNSQLYTSLNVKESDGDGTGDFVLTVRDCNVADGRTTRDAIDALREYGQYRDANGSPGGTWVWFPTYGDGEADFDFKLASSYSGIEAFGNYFQWNRDMQAYLKRAELFSGLLSCDVARAYTGDTLVNTLPAN
jgi:hypothetical protein